MRPLAKDGGTLSSNKDNNENGLIAPNKYA